MVNRDDFEATAYEHLRLVKLQPEDSRPSDSRHEALSTMEELAMEFGQLVDIARQSEIILTNLSQIRACLLEMKSHVETSS